MHSDKIGCFPNGCFDQLKKVNDVLFTLREVDIISCVLNMRGSSKIASILEISSKTVEAHIVNIKRKIDRNAREGIIDFIERSGKGYFVRKHYQHLLIQSDFNKRLKRLSTIVYGDKAPSCYFFDGSEKNKDPIILWLQKHLKFAGINLIICNQEEKIKECKKGEFFIYVLSESNDQDFTNFKELEKITNISETLILLVLKNIKPNLLEQLNKDQYIDFIEQNNYYLTFFEILKKILHYVDLNKTISQLKAYHLSITEPQEYITPSPKLSSEQEISSFVNPINKLREKKRWVIISISLILFNLMIFLYNIMASKIQNKNNKINQKILSMTTFQETIVSHAPEILTGYENFIGRKKELQQADLALNKGNIVVVSGQAGVGKSSFAVEYAKTHKKNKIILYFNASSSTKIDQKYRELAAGMNIDVKQQSKESIMQLVNNKLSIVTTKILFIFDNIDQYNDVKEYIVNLPSTIQAILTTREPMLTINNPHIFLEEFSKEEATLYLKNSLKNRSFTDEFIYKLIEHTGTLPYDLKCLSAYLLDNPLIDSKVNFKEIGGKIQNKLFQEFIDSTDQIKQQAWKILQYAAYLDPDFINIEIIKKLFSKDIEILSAAIKKLEALSLISIINNKNDQSGFRMHRKLQINVQHTAKYYPDHAMPNQHLINNLLKVLDQITPTVTYKSNAEWQTVSNLQSHLENLLNTENKLITKNVKINYTNLCYKLSTYNLIVTVNYPKALKYAKLSLDQMHTLYEANHVKLAEVYNTIGVIYRKLGNVEQGLNYLKKGLKIRQQLYSGAHPDIADSLYSIGIAYNQHGEMQQGLKYSQMSLDMNRKLYSEPHYDIGYSLNAVGINCLDLGEYKKSLEYFTASLNNFTKLDPVNYERVAALQGNLAYVYNKLGNHEEALRYAEASVNILKKLFPNGHPRAIYSLSDLGETLIKLNKINQSLIVLHEALDLSKKFDLNNHCCTGFVFHALGIGYFKKRDYKSAIEYGEKASKLRKKIYDKVKNHHELAESLHSLGDIYLAVGNKEYGLKLYKEAVEMYKSLSIKYLPEIDEINKKISLLL